MAKDELMAGQLDSIVEYKAKEIFAEFRNEHLAAKALFPRVMAGRECPPWPEQLDAVKNRYREKACHILFGASDGNG